MGGSQSRLGWRHGSSGRTPAYQVHRPEDKLQYSQKKNFKKKGEKGQVDNRILHLSSSLSDINIHGHQNWGFILK
jgi:hypothetical protein